MLAHLWVDTASGWLDRKKPRARMPDDRGAFRELDTPANGQRTIRQPVAAVGCGPCPPDRPGLLVAWDFQTSTLAQFVLWLQGTVPTP